MGHRHPGNYTVVQTLVPGGHGYGLARVGQFQAHDGRVVAHHYRDGNLFRTVVAPSEGPANQPTSQPANQPTSQPANQPTSQPANQPTSQPANQPTSQPASQPASTATNAERWLIDITGSRRVTRKDIVTLPISVHHLYSM
jgi:hypothetical protein